MSFLTSQYLTLTAVSSSISLWPVLSFLSVREWSGSESEPRSVWMTVERMLNCIRLAGRYSNRLIANHWLDQQVFRNFQWPHFPFLFFLLVGPFPLPPAKIGLCPFMSQLFSNNLGVDCRYCSGVMLLNWKQCAPHRLWIWPTYWLLTLIVILAFFLLLLTYRPCRGWHRAGTKMPLA